jgi:hypothetical protein
MKNFAWQAESGRYVGRTATLEVACDPLQGLSILHLPSGLRLPRLLGVEIIDAVGLGQKPLAETGFLPEVVCRHDILWVRYAPTPSRPVECQARWRVHSENILDLEVSALTPGKWDGLLVQTCSQPGSREIATLEIEAPPILLYRPAGLAWTYAEMCHPHDGVGMTRDAATGAVRFQLFGHDLEKGVILRGRLRGLWLPREQDETTVRQEYARFVKEPPNLTAL